MNDKTKAVVSRGKPYQKRYMKKYYYLYLWGQDAVDEYLEKTSSAYHEQLRLLDIEERLKKKLEKAYHKGAQGRT